MNPRAVWFLAGTFAGVYGAIKARRAAYRLSMPGLIDQANAVNTAVRYFRAEMEVGMRSKEHELRRDALENALFNRPHAVELPAKDEPAGSELAEHGGIELPADRKSA